VLRTQAAKAAPQVVILMDALKKSVREAVTGAMARRRPQPAVHRLSNAAVLAGPENWL
jgi:hypothetical protein